jgi:3-oxoadipate enol-lactonase
VFGPLGMAMSKMSADSLPPGRYVDLPGRGTTFACEVPGPPGAPALMLFHALSATAYLTWYPSFPALGREFRVAAMDLRGHGRGMECRGRFRLEDCADDAVALADALGIERFIAVGYSIGGPIAQLAWRRHPDRVAGLVLAATSRNYGGTTRERTFYSTLPGLVRAIRLAHRGRAPGPEETALVEEGALPGGVGEMATSRWALAEMGRGSPRCILKAMNAMGRFSSHRWIHEIDVPTAVVVTTADRMVSPARQIKLARAIDGATLHPCAAGHAACVMGSRRFVPALVEACQSVASRLGAPESSESPAGVLAGPRPATAAGGGSSGGRLP